jgi:uncharacterized protein
LTKHADKIYKISIINEVKALKFRLLEVPTEEKEITYVYGVAEVSKALEERDCKQCHPLAPLEVRVRLLRSEKRVFARGWIQGKIELTCARCLEPFGIPIKLEFQQTFLPHAQETATEEEASSADDLDVTYYWGEEVDIAPIIWDEVILDIPFSPLCSRDCKGLCPACGENLNEGECICPPRPGLSRWEALRQIKL